MSIKANQLPNYNAIYNTSLALEMLDNISGNSNAQFNILINDVFSVITSTVLSHVLGPTNSFKTDLEEIQDGQEFIYSSTGMNWILGSVFREMLRDWAHRFSNEESYFSSDEFKNDLSNDFSNLTTSTRVYVNDPLYGSDTHFNLSSMVPVYWIWEIILEFLDQTHKTARNKATAANFFAIAEEKSVILMSKIKFVLQTGENDFLGIRDNMDAQQDSENYRNYRSIIGKNTSFYQNDVQTVMEARSQFIQLSTKLMQDMSSMANSVTRIG